MCFMELSNNFLFSHDAACLQFVAAPPLAVLSVRGDQCGDEPPPQAQLGPEGLTEDEIYEGIQADVEGRHQDGQLLQVEECQVGGAPLPQEDVEGPHQVVRDEAHAEDGDQHGHVLARLGELSGPGGRRLSLLCHRQAAGGAVVEVDQADEDEQEDGGHADVTDLVERAEIFALQVVTAAPAVEKRRRVPGDQRVGHVGARHGHKYQPRYCRDDARSSHRLQDVSS